MQTNSPLAERYDKKTATNGKEYFNLKAGNHQVIGTSQLYAQPLRGMRALNRCRKTGL